MHVTWILAAGGGGSSGFSGGGGGGGGGGGFSGGGGGFGGGGGGGYSGGSGAGGGILFLLIVLVCIVVFVVLPAIAWVRLRARRARDEVRRERRSRRTRTAAAEASDDDAHFAPEAVEEAARTLFLELQDAWTARDRDRLAAIAGPDLLVEWRRRLDDFDRKGWHNKVVVTHQPRIRYVGLTNQEDDTEDRVVVVIECRLSDFVVNGSGGVIFKEGERSAETRLCEYWTLAWTEAGWRIDSIETEDEGAHHLTAPLVATPWSDEERLRDDALVEGAVADAAPEGAPAPGELVDVDYADDAHAAALDLSLVDGRFAPAILEAAVHRVVPAWVAAVDGADDALEKLATPEAVRALLYPDPGDDRARLVIRGGVVDDIRIAKLDTSDGGARMTVEVALRGRRYVEDRDTAAVVTGTREKETTTTERLVLALDATDPAVPWRLVGRG